MKLYSQYFCYLISEILFVSGNSCFEIPSILLQLLVHAFTLCRMNFPAWCITINHQELNVTCSANKIKFNSFYNNIF